MHQALPEPIMSQFDPQQLHDDTERYCEELRPYEELCYVEHQFNTHVISLAKKYNLLGINVDPKYGGRGADAVSYFKALTRIGQEGTGVRTFYSGHLSIGAYPIQTWGSEVLKAKYLPRAVIGDCILAFGLTEPDAGSNPRQMTSTYTKTADGYVLNGVKYLISNGGVAHAVVVFAYPADVPEGPGRRISAFVVDTDANGFTAENLTAKMGMYSSNTAMFEMNNVPVPAENLLGEEGDGFRIAMGTLVSGRLSVAAGCLGVIEDCLNEVLNYGQLREQHGKPIGKHQLVQDHITMIEMARISSEGLLLRASEAIQAMKDNPTDKALAAEADILAAKTKFYITNAAWDAADRAVQVFGGRGWSTLYRPGRHLMDVRVCRIYEGTDEILKLKIAASLLGKDYEAFK
jgi:alkylation response protein AidB-like acyl-CoA dehydrogenase